MKKVFGIGLNKTCTTSLGRALQILGYHHCTWSPTVVDAYINGDKGIVQRFIDAYDSFEDWPWAHLYKELSAADPGYTFILTIRKSPDIWFKSLQRHANGTSTIYREFFYGHGVPLDAYKDEHIAIYNKHIRDVEYFFQDQPHRLLKICIDGGDGWAELCAFLNRKVPEIPFPHANRSTLASQ